MEKLVCDNCGVIDSLLHFYTPIKSQRCAEVFICKSCSLVQTKYKQYESENLKVKKTISTDANWGNVRHGKGIRFTDAKSYLEPILIESKPKNILDIGSNRGDFVKYVLQKDYVESVTAIEPDKSLKNEYDNEFILK